MGDIDFRDAFIVLVSRLGPGISGCVGSFPVDILSGELAFGSGKDGRSEAAARGDPDFLDAYIEAKFGPGASTSSLGEAIAVGPLGISG